MTVFRWTEMADLKTSGIGAMASLRADTLYRAWGLLVLAGLGIGGIVVPASIITTIICPDVRPTSPLAPQSPIIRLTKKPNPGPHRHRRSPHPRHPRHRRLHRLHDLLQRLHLEIHPQRNLLRRRGHGTRARHHGPQSHRLGRHLHRRRPPRRHQIDPGHRGQRDGVRDRRRGGTGGVCGELQVGVSGQHCVWRGEHHRGVLSREHQQIHGRSCGRRHVMWRSG